MPRVPNIKAAEKWARQTEKRTLRNRDAKTRLKTLYKKAAAAYSGLAPSIAPLLAEHEAHLAQLRGRVIEPAGKRVPDAVTARPRVGATKAAALAQLRAAEHAAIATLMSRLDGASPSLAQLYASIAASEATHVTALTSLIGS